MIRAAGIVCTSFSFCKGKRFPCRTSGSMHPPLMQLHEGAAAVHRRPALGFGMTVGYTPAPEPPELAYCVQPQRRPPRHRVSSRQQHFGTGCAWQHWGRQSLKYQRSPVRFCSDALLRPPLDRMPWFRAILLLGFSFSFATTWVPHAST